MEQEQKKLLPALLLAWYRANARDLPWRRDREPYHVWLSEIMLQQTRVEAVKDSYVRFLKALPTVQALAEADEELVFKLWEGLGYYSRARNLQRAARVIVRDHGGVFPQTYEAVRALPGIGDYTAGAVCSIAFEQPRAAVDGNVLRVMARLEASERCVGELQVKRELQQALEAIYPAGSCGDFTQSLMELGATVCLPRGEPRCGVCPAADICRSRAEGLWRRIPVLPEKKTRRTQEKTVFILRRADKTAIRKRPAKGLLAGLWQFPEAPGKLTEGQAVELLEQWGLAPRGLIRCSEKEHIFTHVRWVMRGYYVYCGEMPKDFQWVTDEELAQVYSIPTAFRQFWDPNIFEKE